MWWWFWPRGIDNSGTNTPPLQDNIVLPPSTPPLTNTSTPPPVISSGELAVTNLARNFSERYGSWSTDSGFQNLYDLFPVITASLRQEFETTIARSASPSNFVGYSTKALNIDIQRLTEAQATVVVTTQRVQSGAGDNPVDYEDLRLTMVKQGDFWYVDSADWQKAK